MVVLVIAGYVVFVGASASVVRAGIMGLLVVLGPAFGRPSYAVNSLAFAALGMAILWPFMLWDVGFQLSFAATLAILLLVQPLSEAFERWLIRHVANVSARETIMLVSGDLMTSLAATLVTLPIIAYDFHNLSLIGLVVNLLVLPAQPLVMATGLLVISAGWIHPALGQVAGWLAWPFLAWTSRVVEWAASLPFASLDVSVPPWAVALYYVILVSALAWWLAQRRTTDDRRPTMDGGSRPHATPGTQAVALAVVGLIIVLVWAGAGAQPDGLLRVSFLDVGQGNATLIRTPSGQVVVIDGGPGATALIDALGRSMPFYEHEVALGVLTRAADENLTGLVSMLERYPPLRWWRRRRSAQHGQRALARLDRGTNHFGDRASDMRIDLGDGVQLLVLEGGDETTGMTLRLSYGQFSIHFDGGGAAATATAPATILRAAGHGNNVSQPLLDALAPSFIVYSLAGTRAAAPSGDMLVQLAEVGATIYRTDTNGTIKFTSDGERVWVETER